MSAPAPLLGEKQTSGGRLAATDFMSTHPGSEDGPVITFALLPVI